MIPFLQTIAEAYSKRYDDLSDFTFVFPNKRAGTFFLRHLNAAALGSASVAPQITTVAELTERLSGRLVAGRIDLLFILYNAYRRLALRQGNDPGSITFDSFRTWGDVVLSDFNEIDMYCVDPEALFINVKRFKEIQSSFLTPEQRRVMEEYFGSSIDTGGAVERFWKHFDPNDEDPSASQSIVKKKFLRLWENLYPLYSEFNSDLESLGLCYSGKASGLALKAIEEKGTGAIGGSKVVMVGFNVLSPVEWKMFKALSKLKSEHLENETYADFIWDMTGIPMEDSHNSAMRFMKRNIEAFPKPAWLDLSPSDTDGIPEVIRLIASPSNALQAKITGKLMGELIHKAGEDAIKNAKAAVVLPDEGLLLPLLYSLPEDMQTLNLTMGYSMRLTPTLSFVALIRRMQQRKRISGGRIEYLTEDVETLLSHPLTFSLIGNTAIKKIREYISQGHYFTLSVCDIERLAPESTLLFTPFTDNMSQKPASLLDAILEACINSLAHIQNTSQTSHTRLDISHLQAYRDALRRIDEAAAKYCVDFDWLTLFQLSDKIIGRQRVAFEGEPLEGMQVMGLLETRALDFEYLIVPSFNERILPQRMRQKTFIPASLRRGFGMAPANFQENIFSYYFYRMIARAKEVFLIYDARTGGMRTGGVSRYALQLKHLYAQGKVEEISVDFALASHNSEHKGIEKTDLVMEQLRRYLDPNEAKNLSASAISNFLQCPELFYLKNVLKINDDPERSEYMDAITQGNVIHSVLQRIYTPDKSDRNHYLTRPLIYSADFFRSMVSDTKKLMQLITEEINIHYYRIIDPSKMKPLRGHTLLIAKELTRQIKRVLLHDATLAPLKIWGTEVRDTFQLPISGQRSVNITYSFDRLDSPAGSDRIRVVDYKTGGVHIEAPDLDTMFEGNYKGRYAFQLLCYAAFYTYHRMHTLHSDNLPVDMAIYHLPAPTDTEVYIKVDGKEHRDNGLLGKEFTIRLQSVIERIFDSAESFSPCPDPTICVNCPYAAICS